MLYFVDLQDFFLVLNFSIFILETIALLLRLKNYKAISMYGYKYHKDYDKNLGNKHKYSIIFAIIIIVVLLTLSYFEVIQI